MKSIPSSFFGRIFGHATKINIVSEGLQLLVKGRAIDLAWQQLTCPPLFSAGLLGQSVTFCVHEQTYTLSKLAYNCAQKQQTYCQLQWAAANKKRLVALLTQIDKYISSRYLRQSSLNKIQLLVKQESQRWLPWGLENKALQNIAPLVKLLAQFQHWQAADIIACREKYINKQLQTYKSYFDNIESNPLTQRQRRACIIDDDNNLLLAGAGTGKTSVMVGRTGYLLISQLASHKDILLLAYGRQAANEMDERIKDKLQTEQVSATTFHSLGLNIIAQVEGAKPNLSAFAEDQQGKDKWIESCFEALIKDQQYRHLALEYCSQYYYAEKSAFEFASLGEYYRYLNDNDVRSLKGDKVKSFAELHIANWLFNHGIDYQYQTDYQHRVKTLENCQYRPDFFLPELNIYIEYYAIDENGDTARYLDKDKYHALIKCKREIHRQKNTRCIELTYAQYKAVTLENTLQERFTESNIEAALIADDLRLASLRETGRVTDLAAMFGQLLGLYKAACLDKASEQIIIADAADPRQTAKAFALLEPLLTAYQDRLLRRNEIDFEDMISKALSYIESGRFVSPWRFIMVDEFQDISEPRARLIKALRDSNKGSSVFAVGDDWQAIYRFSGADVNLTTGFQDYFGPTTQTELDQTFRFNNRIGEVASKFISQNPAQISKSIKSFKQVNAPAISLLRKSSLSTQARADNTINEMANGAIDQVLTAISQRVTKPSSVYLLARFWFQLPDKETINTLNRKYPMLQIAAQSFHAAKGKEADHVLLMGLNNGAHGFPSEKATPAIVNALLAKEDEFKHAEERRLFYVALTRAKDRAYIIADMSEASCFVKELVDGYDIELNEFALSAELSLLEEISCQLCKTGTLKARQSHLGRFFSCSHFPRCAHKERACDRCQNVMIRSRYPGFKSCANEKCNYIFPLCVQCGAEMVLRKNERGEFWGCRNYHGNDPLSCKNAVAKAKIKFPQLAV